MCDNNECDKIDDNSYSLVHKQIEKSTNFILPIWTSLLEFSLLTYCGCFPTKKICDGFVTPQCPRSGRFTKIPGCYSKVKRWRCSYTKNKTSHTLALWLRISRLVHIRCANNLTKASCVCWGMSTMTAIMSPVIAQATATHLKSGHLLMSSTSVIS